MHEECDLPTSAESRSPNARLPSRRLVVCADDYALTPGVSRGIRELLVARRISATSVMTVSEHWPAAAESLRAVAGAADIGLHITLTDQRPLGTMATLAPRGRLPPMSAVYRAGLARRLPRAELRAEIERQVAAFIAHYGAPPAHIDGHHHVHQLPGVRDIVLEVAARLGPGTWVRCCGERPSNIWLRGVAVAKALTIGALGGGLARRARAAGVPVNHGFSGAYDFARERRPIGELFGRFVLEAGDSSVVMCHPGHVDAALGGLDPMTTPREAELDYLMSPQWPALLAAHGLQLGPLRRREPSAS